MMVCGLTICSTARSASAKVPMYSFRHGPQTRVECAPSNEAANCCTNEDARRRCAPSNPSFVRHRSQWERLRPTPHACRPLRARQSWLGGDAQFAASLRGLVRHFRTRSRGSEAEAYLNYLLEPSCDRTCFNSNWLQPCFGIAPSLAMASNSKPPSTSS